MVHVILHSQPASRSIKIKFLQRKNYKFTTRNMNMSIKLRLSIIICNVTDIVWFKSNVLKPNSYYLCSHNLKLLIHAANKRACQWNLLIFCLNSLFKEFQTALFPFYSFPICEHWTYLNFDQLTTLTLKFWDLKTTGVYRVLRDISKKNNLHLSNLKLDFVSTFLFFIERFLFNRFVNLDTISEWLIPQFKE